MTVKLSKSEERKLIDAHREIAERELHYQLLKMTRKELRKEWGDKYESNMKQVCRLLDDLQPPKRRKRVAKPPSAAVPHPTHGQRRLRSSAQKRPS